MVADDARDAAIPLQPWLEHLRRHLPVARAGLDPEGVHQVRVALARIDLWLRLAGWRVLRDDVAWLRKGADRLRDLDVQLASGSPAEWLPWLRRQHAEARVRFVALLASPRLEALLQALATLPPLAVERAEAALAELVRKARKHGARLERHPHDVERSHALRKRVRRVRYGLEWLDRSAKPVKQLQDELGHLNDAAVRARLLKEWSDAELSRALRAGLEREIAADQSAAVASWRASELREDGAS